MEPNREKESRDETRTTEQKGTLLRPSTIGILKRALAYYLEYERDFVGVFFPKVAARKYVTWADLFELTDRQADAMRPIVVDSIYHFRRQDGRERNKNVDLLARTPLDPGFVSEYARRADLWTDALRDLCEVYGLKSPL
jgi:hypothetical protein